MALRAGVASGDQHAIREALDDLRRREGAPLSSEGLAELATFLDRVDGHMLEELSRALIMSGGEEGVALVMGFIENPDRPLDDRERALRGISHLPREMADDVAPALVDLLESDLPRGLQHSAAHSLGRLYREEATDALLGLLEERPGLPHDVLFDAIGDTGRPEDTGRLVDLLGGEWSGRERMGLLRSIARISAREGGDGGEGLLEMLREPPEGVSKSMVARAISDASHHLEPALLEAAMSEVSGDGRAQESLARALARSGGRAGIEALVELSKNPDYRFDQRALAHALHDIGGPQSIPWMMDMIRGASSEDVVQSLARGVFRGGQKESVESLMGLLRGGNDSQRRAIAHSLRGAESSSLDMGRLLGALRNENDHDVRREIAHAISDSFGDRGTREVVDMMRTTVDSDQRSSLMWGLENAWRRESPQARSVFTELARSDPAPHIRREAIHILRRHGDATLLPLFEGLLRSEANPEVQETLGEALAELRAGS